jgi:DtxR family transcriptional regulator, Mn-dependent transcriptional regulator
MDSFNVVSSNLISSLTQAEENYLKVIFHANENNEAVSTNVLAKSMQTKASSATDMMQRMADKNLVNYQKYYGASLTNSGKTLALQVIRKHRLWEVFLLKTLDFAWDEVHEIAEQLEHIQSPKLINKLDHFLGFPEFDPHGDPIPDANGKMPLRPETIALQDAPLGKTLRVVSVNDNSVEFLQYLDAQNLRLGTLFKITQKMAFDGSIHIETERNTLLLSVLAIAQIKVEICIEANKL